MSRRSKVLVGYQAVLIELVEAIHQTYGCPKGLEKASLPDHDLSTWWRWRTGKRIFPRSYAIKMANLALADSKVGDKLSDTTIEQLISLISSLDQPVQKAVDAIIRDRTGHVRRLRDAAKSAEFLDDPALAAQITALAETQEELVRGFMARDYLIVSKVYEMAQNQIYFDGLDKDAILNSEYSDSSDESDPG